MYLDFVLLKKLGQTVKKLINIGTECTEYKMILNKIKPFQVCMLSSCGGQPFGGNPTYSAFGDPPVCS